MTRRELLRLGAAAAAAFGPWPTAMPSGGGGRPVPGPRTTVARHRGKPLFFIDGNPYTKPVFETYVPETRFFRQFTAAGSDIFSFSTNLGAGFGAQTWIGPDQWDFSTLDEIARRVREANPRGLLLPRIYFNGPEKSAEAMRELTGIRLVPSAKCDPVHAAIRLIAGSHAIVDEVLRQGAATIGWPHVRASEMAVEDPSATALGTGDGSSAVALALRTMRDWTSVYTLNPVLPAAFLRALARHAGVHIYNDRDDTLYASRSYVTLAANGAGARAIRLPRSADVYDPFTGTRLWKAVTRFEVMCRERETLLWRLA
jgi:hypothetical protein